MKIEILRLDDFAVDGNGDIMPTDAQITFSEDLLITKSFSHEVTEILGKGRCTREGNSIFVEFDPKLLPVKINESLLEELTPAISGRINKAHVEDYRVVNDFTIDYVAFTLSNNCDKAIESIKNQLLKRLKK